MQLDDLTSSEFSKIVSPKSVLILPVGATEEHGAHLPLSTDSLQPEFVAQEVAKRIIGCLVAPSLRYGDCSSTQNFPGTLSISHESLSNFVYDLLKEFVRNGILNIVVLSGHAGSGHMCALREAAKQIVDENEGKNLNILVLSDYDLAYERRGKEVPETDGHAGMLETSRLMHIAPQLVRKDKAIIGKGDLPRFKIIRDPEKYWSGVTGDPTKASTKIGKVVDDYIINELEKIIITMMKS